MKIRDDGSAAPVRHEGIRGSGGIAPLTLREEKTQDTHEQEALWTPESASTLASKQTTVRLSDPQTSQ